MDRSEGGRSFLEFVLGQYIERGIDELDQEKLPDLLRLKFGGVTDATTSLGKSPQTIREAFVGFQPALFEQ